GHRLRRGVELARGGGIAQSRFHTPHHGLSTFRRQGSILVAVHLVSPWNTEASQPQLPRFGPDEQPPERPHLDKAPFTPARSWSNPETSAAPARTSSPWATARAGWCRAPPRPAWRRRRSTHAPAPAVRPAWRHRKSAWPRRSAHRPSGS